MNEPWLERWSEGRIGFHESDGNAALRKFWNVSGRRVLVPLCGKSVDLLWLADQGNAVTGIELSEIAVRAFFAENGLDMQHDPATSTYRATDRDITIHCGDYFAFGETAFDACYDRAALIAMPPGLRPDYVRKTRSLLAGECFQLLITVEYDQAIVDGPPYSVPAREVQSYWPHLEKLAASDDLANSPPRFREAGLEQIREVVWRATA